MHTPAGFWRSSFSRKARETFRQCVARVAVLAKGCAKRVCSFVLFACSFVICSNFKLFHPFLSFQTSNLHPFLSLKLIIRSSFFLETSSIRLDLCNLCSTFDLPTVSRSWKRWVIHCIASISCSFSYPERARASKRFKMKKEGSQVQLPSRVLNLVFPQASTSCPWKMARSSYTWSIHAQDKLVLGGWRTSYTWSIRVQDNIGPMKNLMDSSAPVLYVIVYGVSCFLYMHCFSCTPWSQLIIDPDDAP